MLNIEKAQTFGLSSKVKLVQLNNPSFFSSSIIWLKTKQYPLGSSLKITNKKHHFFKYGKTLGFQTKRFLQYCNGFLYYYEQEHETEPKGYCQLQNLYMYFLECTKNNFILYLTNGADSSVLYFPNDNFLKNIESQFFKDIIQVNYKQKYKIMEQIGEGTFSKVYLAQNRVTKEKYALKIMSKTKESDFQIKQIVQQEKLILKKLNSHLTSKMYEFFEDQEDFVFVLEYIQGQNLSKELKNRGQLPINEVIHIIKETLKALEVIHQHKIIHRDLKPQNIIYSPQEKTIKLIDFGLSLCYNQSTQLSKFIRCGTMGYLAPQIAVNYEKSRKKYDCKSDMFGLGIICHMLLLGKNPLKGKNYKTTCENNIKCMFTLDQLKITQKYGQSCFYFLKSLLQIDPKLRLSATEALKHSFLNTNFKDQDPLFNEQQMSMQSTKTYNYQQINYIEDKQRIFSPSKYNNLSNSLQISSPYKKEECVNTATSFQSGPRFSGLS